MGRGLTRTARIAWIVGWVGVVFAVWLTAASHSVGIAFFYSVPVGFTAWWFGPRAGLVVALVCVGLYAIGNAIHPTSEFALALVVRAAFLLLVVAVVSWVATRLRLLEHSAEELEAIRAALTPADLPDLPEVDAAAAFVPSELGVSGDHGGRQMLGLEGLRGMLAPLSGSAARAMVDEVDRAILVWADRPIKDDICLVVLKPKLA